MFWKKAPDFGEKFFGQNVRMRLYRKSRGQKIIFKGHTDIEHECKSRLLRDGEVNDYVFSSNFAG